MCIINWNISKHLHGAQSRTTVKTVVKSLLHMLCQACGLWYNNVDHHHRQVVLSPPCLLNVASKGLVWDPCSGSGADFTSDFGSSSESVDVSLSSSDFTFVKFDWCYVINMTSNSTHTSTKLTKRWLQWNPLCSCAAANCDLVNTCKPSTF